MAFGEMECLAMLPRPVGVYERVSVMVFDCSFLRDMIETSAQFFLYQFAGSMYSLFRPRTSKRMQNEKKPHVQKAKAQK